MTRSTTSSTRSRDFTGPDPPSTPVPNAWRLEPGFGYDPSAVAERPKRQEVPGKTGRQSTRAAARIRRRAGFSLLDDVGAIIAHSHDLQSALERIVQVVAERMETEVCSLYIYDARERRLTLWATQGLNRESIG